MYLLMFSHIQSVKLDYDLIIFLSLGFLHLCKINVLVLCWSKNVGLKKLYDVTIIKPHWHDHVLPDNYV